MAFTGVGVGESANTGADRPLGGVKGAYRGRRRRERKHRRRQALGGCKGGVQGCKAA